MDVIVIGIAIAIYTIVVFVTGVIAGIIMCAVNM